MPSKLSNTQKFILADLSRQAWHRAGPGDDGITETEFRQREVAAACGKIGLRACSQADYKIVEAHFYKLLGRVAREFQAHYDDATNQRRVAQFKLIEACKLAGVKLGYAAAICRAKYKCELDDATVSQLWKLKFDIDRRRARRGRATLSERAAKLPLPAPNAFGASGRMSG